MKNKLKLLSRKLAQILLGNLVRQIVRDEIRNYIINSADTAWPEKSK